MPTKVAFVYRTVSREAIIVVSGIIPIDILAMERRRSYVQRRGEEYRSYPNKKESHSGRH